MRKIRIWILLLGGLLALWPGIALAGGGGGGGGPCGGFASGTTLLMRDSCFDGIAHFVQVGGTLRVRNDGQLPHSFTVVDGSFDTGVLQPGQSAQIKLGEAGIVRAYCTLHGNMQGRGMAGILVVGNPGAAALGAATASEDSPATSGLNDESVRTALEAQARSLEGIQAEIAAARGAIEQSAAEARSASPLLNWLPAALGLLGAVLGGAALGLVLWRSRPAGAAAPREPARKDGEEHLGGALRSEAA